MLLYIKGQLIWTTHVRVISSLESNTIFKKVKIPQIYVNIVTSL